MVFDISKSPSKKLEKFYTEAMKDLSKFYEIGWTRNKPVVLLVNDRKTINLIRGEETEDWVVGFTDGLGFCLFLLTPESFESQSSHKYSDKEYRLLMKHEVSHLFSRILYPGYTPKWLVEGLAIYSSGQLDLKSKPTEFKTFLSFFEKGGSGLYSESGFAVQILIENFRKENFFDFYKSMKDVKKDKDFKKLFKKYYNADLEYSFFNKYL